jgi:hypothetical protein
MNCFLKCTEWSVFTVKPVGCEASEYMCKIWFTHPKSYREQKEFPLIYVQSPGIFLHLSDSLFASLYLFFFLLLTVSFFLHLNHILCMIDTHLFDAWETWQFLFMELAVETTYNGWESMRRHCLACAKGLPSHHLAAFHRRTVWAEVNRYGNYCRLNKML